MSKRSCFVVVALSVVSAPIAAQRLGDPIFEITVIAPRLIRQEVGHTNGGTPVEMISLTRRVDYQDLNLKQQASVVELETRISEVAQEACGQLASAFPLSDPKTPDCVKDAVAKAMAQVRAVVAATNK